jgi:stearoyl-CoA desaturase (delta-9 desaturase)
MTLTSSPTVADRPAEGVAPTPTPSTSSPTVLLAQRAFTALLVVGPLAALSVAVPFWWGHVIHLRDVILAVVLYAVTGHGITIGFHRLFTHRSFTPNRALKIALAVTGSMAVEGSVIGWVAGHRRHHRFSDKPGDPHSPHRYGAGIGRQLRGLAYAHVGWLFADDPTCSARYAPDLEADRDLVRVSRLFPALAALSFALPFGLGWALSGTLGGALGALLWAGVVRMFLLHHVTWSINSVCHMFGSRPFRTKDRSTNVAPLAVLTMGESWHNLHHAYPQSARHGVLPGQRDSSAALIRLFERAGWATDVHWPDPARVAGLLVEQSPGGR